MDCVFCKIVTGAIPAKILNQSTHSIALLDAFPLAKGHTLVIPKKHYSKIQDMSVEENTDLFSLVSSMLGKVDSITGSTLVAAHNGADAGQDIPHVHIHIVPRSKDDSAGPIHSMFDPTIKLSESDIQDTYDKIKCT